jgi:hypothetical protein
MMGPLAAAALLAIVQLIVDQNIVSRSAGIRRE